MNQDQRFRRMLTIVEKHNGGDHEFMDGEYRESLIEPAADQQRRLHVQSGNAAVIPDRRLQPEHI